MPRLYAVQKTDDLVPSKDEQLPVSQSNASESMASREVARTGYEAAIALWTNEGSIFWARFNALLVANSIVLGTQALLISSQRPPLGAVILLSIAGLLICLLWYLGCDRSLSYYGYWIHSARELEEIHLAPIVRTVSRGADFAEGRPVNFRTREKDLTYQLGRSGRMRIKHIAYVIIAVFAVLYLAVPTFAFSSMPPNSQTVKREVNAVAHAQLQLPAQAPFGTKLNWLESHSGGISALSSMLLTIITIVYVYLTGRLVRESQAMRSAMLQPELAIYLHSLEGSLNFIILRIENVGSAAAHKIHLATDRPFETAGKQDLRELGIFKKGVNYLAPKQRIDHFLVNLIGKLEELGKQPLIISASYEDAAGKLRKEEFALDFKEMENLACIGVPPMNEIANSVKKLQEDFGRIATGFNKLQILTEPAADYRHLMDSQSLAWRLEKLSPEQLKEIEALIAEKSRDQQTNSPIATEGQESA